MESGVYLVGGVVTMLLFTYLVFALVKPEWFA